MSSAVPTRAKVLSLYRSLLKTGKQYKDYNFREYIVRHVREDFRNFRSASDPEMILKQFHRGERDLAVAERQLVVQNLYRKGRSVIEATS
mmetsp:Transcript_364/g.614  ORF Transcript_364/g.614 Transcript_364/m.614 type:complete len:90 (+) Transcript_364:56-325(+)